SIAVANLAPEDSVSVIGYNDKLEMISDWTNDRQSVYQDIDKKLFTSRRERFAEGIDAAVQMFAARPVENRHLVIVSDGVDSVRGNVAVRKGMAALIAANITVHVISYTGLEADAAGRSAQRVNLGKGDTKPRIRQEEFEDMLRAMAGPNDRLMAARFRA